MVDPRDLQPQGDPETVVTLPTGESLIGLYIKGVHGPTMLGIKEDAEGQPVSCGIGIALDLPHPHRHKADWRSEDGA